MGPFYSKFMLSRMWQAIRWRLGQRVAAPELEFGDELSLAAKLRALQFDLAIILLGDQFAHLLARVGIPIRIGVKEHQLAPCLTHHYSIGSPRTWGPEERLGALRCLGYKVESVKPRLWVDRDARESASLKLRSFGIEAGGKICCLASIWK